MNTTTQEPTYRGHAIPRDPGAYRPTTHFLQRRYYRDPPPTGAVLRYLFANGTLHESPRADADNAYIFATELDGQEWRLVVGLDPEAFERDGAKHDVLTAICEAHDDWDDSTYTLADTNDR